MALTKNTLPSQTPRQIVPFDANLAFQAAFAAQAASGFVNGGAQIDIGPGRYDGNLVIDISAMKFTATDEKYQFFLVGSNDVAFGNGNCDVLAVSDFAALAANRLLPAISANSDAVPPAGMSSGRFVVPFINLRGEYVLRYLRLYLVMGGTAPTITFKSWVSIDCD